MELKYRKMLEIYEVLENDGVESIKDDVNCFTVAYKNGEPTKAILAVNLDIGTILERCGPAMKTVEDPLNLEKIADFFNKK